MARLISLSSEAVGGILLVKQQFAPDGPKTEPCHYRVGFLGRYGAHTVWSPSRRSAVETGDLLLICSF